MNVSVMLSTKHCSSCNGKFKKYAIKLRLSDWKLKTELKGTRKHHTCIHDSSYQFMFAIKPQPETGKKPGTVPNHTAADGTQEDGWREKLGTVHVWWREWRRGRITAYKGPNKRDQEVREKLGTRRQPETGKKPTPVPNHTAAQKHKKMKREAGNTSTAWNRKNPRVW